MELAPGTTLDRYVIETQLGQGAMAVVYLARHATLGTRYAIKVLQITTPSVKQRLVQEGRVQAALRHPNIVTVNDVIEMHGSPVLVMELVEGLALDDLIKKGPLTIEQVDDLARGIIAGVAHAHRHGVLHRDLKPANVMLAVTEQGLVPKVSDFGLAKVLDSGEGTAKTRSGTTMGTPCYMAPEQIRNAKNVDRRADVWAVGTILYEMLCGTRAFDGEDLIDVFSVVSKGSYVPIADRVPDVPERMRRAIESALVVDKDARIADCDLLLKLWTSEGTPSPVQPRGPWAGMMQALQRPASPTLSPASEPVPKTMDATWHEGGAAPIASTLGDDAHPGPAPQEPHVSSTLGEVAPPKPSATKTVQTSMADNTAMRIRPAAIAGLGAAPAPASPLRLVAMAGAALAVVLTVGVALLAVVAVAGFLANSTLMGNAAPVIPPLEPPFAEVIAPSTSGEPPAAAPVAVGSSGVPEPTASAPPDPTSSQPQPEPVKAPPAVPKPAPPRADATKPPPAPITAAPALPAVLVTPAVVAEPVVVAPPPLVVAPAAPSLPRLRIKGDIPADRVSLRNAAKTYFWVNDEIPPGTYDIFIYETQRAGTLTVLPGSDKVEVTCISDGKCTS